MKLSFSALSLPALITAALTAVFHISAAFAQPVAVQEADLDKWIAKNNAYVKLLNETLRASDSHAHWNIPAPSRAGSPTGASLAPDVTHLHTRQATRLFRPLLGVTIPPRAP